MVKTVFGEYPFYNHIKDVPVDVTALTVGTSGFGDSKFVEIVNRNTSIADLLHLDIGLCRFINEVHH